MIIQSLGVENLVHTRHKQKCQVCIGKRHVRLARQSTFSVVQEKHRPFSTVPVLVSGIQKVSGILHEIHGLTRKRQQQLQCDLDLLVAAPLKESTVLQHVVQNSKQLGVTRIPVVKAKSIL